MLNSLREMWVESNTPIDYVVSLWISSLFVTTLVGFIGLFYRIFTGQVDLNNATFGIFDTLG